jgi:cytidylate kinase
MIITIAGLPGAGKTSVAKELAARLGCEYMSVGEIRGKMAIERGITIDQLNNMGTESDWIADAEQIKLSKSGKDIVIEGRISWHLIPQSFKILVTVDQTEGARRIFEDKKLLPSMRADERPYVSVEDARLSIAARVASDEQRMQELYGIDDFADPKHFDYVLDTTRSSGPAENANKIMDELRKRGLLK